MVFDIIKEQILKTLNVSSDDVKPEARFIEDLGADSLDAVELVLFIETEFGVIINEEELSTLKTLGEMVKFIEDRIQK